MYLKIILVVFLMTLIMSSLSKDLRDNDPKSKSTSSSENIDLLNSPDTKNDIEAKIIVIKNFFPYQPQLEAERMDLGYIRRIPFVGEESFIKKRIDFMKKQDRVLATKLTKFYEKYMAFESAVDCVVKYIMDANKNDAEFAKATKIFYPLEDILTETVKNFRTIQF